MGKGKDHPRYQDILTQILELPREDQLQLLLELADGVYYGFGMWETREELKDVQQYVEKLRQEVMSHPDGRRKTPEEFLAELEKWE